jgi:hypothetical protein
VTVSGRKSVIGLFGSIQAMHNLSQLTSHMLSMPFGLLGKGSVISGLPPSRTSFAGLRKSPARKFDSLGAACDTTMK